VVEYQIAFDDSFFVAMLRRYREVHAWRRTRVVVKVLLILFLVVCVAGSLAQKWWGMAGFWAAVIGLLLASPRIDYWIAKRRFRLSPFRDESIRLSMGPDGVHSVSSSHDQRMAWRAYTKAYKLDDGILLLMGPHLFQWLPDAAMVAGTRADADALIRGIAPEASQAEQSLAAESR
jgi:hypothetical protein